MVMTTQAEVRATKPTPRYQAVCGSCYNCVLKVGTKDECNRVATSHMNIFHHDVCVFPVRLEVKS